MTGDIPVYLACPACGYTWRSAIIEPGAWWAAGLTPEKCAKTPWCPQCEQPPPMRVVDSPAGVLVGQLAKI